MKLETYRRKKSDDIENDLGENMTIDKLIVMDNVSGLADRSEEFGNFLTVHKNTDCHVFTFFTSYIQQDKTGKW